jgi:hypothetical protein
MAQHGQRQALAETAGTDKEEELVSRLYLRDILRLVYIITIIFPYSNEVHHAVGDALTLELYVLFHATYGLIYANIHIFFEIHIILGFKEY